MDDQPDDFDFALRHPIPAVKEVKNLPVPYKPAHEDIDFEAGLNEIESHYHRVCAALPPGYEFDQSRNLIVRKKDGSKRAKAICSSLAILAFLPPAGRIDAMLEVQFLDEDAQVVAMQIPYSDLASSYPAAIAMLRNRGLYMPATTRDMAEFLRAFRPRIKRLPAIVNGWSPDETLIFGLQDKRIVATAGTPLSSHLTAFTYEGDKLRHWKAKVAAKFSGSNIPLFFLCAAFAGPILNFLHLPTFALTGRCCTTLTGEDSHR